MESRSVRISLAELSLVIRTFVEMVVRRFVRLNCRLILPLQLGEGKAKQHFNSGAFMDFKELRKEYETHGIDDSELNADPFQTFRLWMQSATDACPGTWYEPNAMTLATAGLDGLVTARTVLLKAIDEESIRFYSNYESTKGKQLAENHNAAVTFHWAWLGRQVHMRGSVEKTSREDSESYFHSRPRGSQLAALASQQSSRIESREQLEKIRAALESKHEGQPVPLPDNWGGYRLTPVTIEFWQGRLDRMHDRAVYQKESGEKGSDAWERFRIAP